MLLSPTAEKVTKERRLRGRGTKSSKTLNFKPNKSIWFLKILSLSLPLKKPHLCFFVHLNKSKHKLPRSLPRQRGRRMLWCICRVKLSFFCTSLCRKRGNQVLRHLEILKPPRYHGYGLCVADTFHSARKVIACSGLARRSGGSLRGNTAQRNQ